MGPHPVRRETTLRVRRDLLDFTSKLRRVQNSPVGRGSFGAVYHCFCGETGDVVAVKAFEVPKGLSRDEQAEFKRKMKREPGIWRRLDHPNIVPLLGTVDGAEFLSDYTCMASMWMPNGTLLDYVGQDGTLRSLSNRIRLIKGTVTGLEYLHSIDIIHADFHPGNILIDSDDNPRITDFGYSQTLFKEDTLTYLFTKTIRAGMKQFVAPELLNQELSPDPGFKAMLQTDIYSLGSIILFILSGKLPWGDRKDFTNRLKERENPPRPLWPVIPDVVWGFIERCWSPQAPGNRPSAQDVLSFSIDQLEQLSLQSSTSDINVVLFGAVGSGKSSMINLLSGKSVARVSVNMEPCTRRPRCFQIPSGERQFRLWDTTGFCLPSGVPIDSLSPYQQAHTLLRDLPNGVHLILLCVSMDEIRSKNRWIRSLYWFINGFLFGGRAPLAFVLTHFDTSKNDLEEWWSSNQSIIVSNTEVPISSIPRACSTTARSSESRQQLLSFLEEHTISVFPISLRLDLSSHEAASHAIASKCHLGKRHAVALVNRLNRPPNQFNVVLLGRAGAGKSSIINLLAGERIAPASSNARSSMSTSGSYTINTPKKQFVISETMGFHSMCNDRAVMNTARLIHTLSTQSGIDLLVFVKDSGAELTTSEAYYYRLVEEFLCGGQVPVAVVVTHLENYPVMEHWWKTNGHGLLKSLRGNLIGHACITSAGGYGPEETKSSKKLSESRQKVQTLLEACFSDWKAVEIPDKSTAKEGREMDRAPERMTVENLMKHCGLMKELANDVVRLYSTGR